MFSIRLPLHCISCLLFGVIVAYSSSFTIGQDAKATKSIVMIAGNASHGYGAHEHYAGCRLLADVLQAGSPNIRCTVTRNGWPEDDAMLDQADTIVMYADGGAKHPAIAHMDRLQKQIDRGAGFVCLHYAVEVPSGDVGNKFKDWLGGYFEADWSVNPHWTADFNALPNHPITHGVKSFSANDEWYFHLRFQDAMKGVTPILSAIPPASTMSRPDGHHSGNPTVRKAVADGLPQHVAWAFDRPNGGRSFGFTGGHYHWNWGSTEMQRVVCNAILWTAKAELAPSGFPCGPLDLERLKANQDEPIPAKFSEDETIKTFDLKSGAH
ncbi:MAG: ThuA domain-containing protein [Pirellulaceae bacterium]|nr:ThuA domain-containing protein [Pirellulaceae bacterium]